MFSNALRNLPCNRQINIKISDEELKLIRERMEQLGFKNMSAYIRKMAIDGYCINNRKNGFEPACRRSLPMKIGNQGD